MKKYIPVIVTAVTMSFVSPLIKYVGLTLDSASQTFYRYLIALVCLGIYIPLFRKKEWCEVVKHWTTLIIPAALFYVSQILLVIGIDHKEIQPGFAWLLFQTNGPITVFLAVLFFRQEREELWNKKLAIVLLMVALGSYGLLTPKGIDDNFVLNYGSAALLTAALVTAFYTLAFRKISNTIDPICVFTIMAIMMTPIYGIHGYLTGGLSAITELNSSGILAILVSAIVCLTIGNIAYVRSIQVIGPSRTALICCASPALTVVWSYLVFVERMTVWQLACGLILLIGCAMTTLSGKNKKITE